MFPLPSMVTSDDLVPFQTVNDVTRCVFIWPSEDWVKPASVLRRGIIPLNTCAVRFGDFKTILSVVTKVDLVAFQTVNVIKCLFI